MLATCAQRAQLTVKVGRTPTCWRDAYACEARKVAAVPKLCAWVTDSYRPRLRDQPLLGHCLSEMFDDRRPVPDYAESIPAKADHTRFVHPPSADPKADWTCSPSPIDHPDRRAPEPPSPPERQQSRPLSSTVQPLEPGADRPPPDSGPGSTPTQAARIETPARSVYAAPTCADGRLLTRLAGEHGTSPSPAWRVHETQRRRRRAARETRDVGVHADRARRRQIALSAAGSGDASAFRASLDDRVLRRLGAGSSQRDDVVGDRRIELLARVLGGPGAPSALLERFAPRARHYRAHDQTDAPAFIAQQPYLEPPPLPYTPPIPVATAALRRGARREREEIQPTEPLDLTEKISRILDDEARRHGIDV
jgi:hypothetical protein